jgi:signal transduction histidine kinase
MGGPAALLYHDESCPMSVPSDKTSAATLRDGLSHRQTRVVFFLGFGGLLFLMGFFGVSAISALSNIRVREEGIRSDYLGRERVLQKLRAGIYTSGTHIRDFLLDTNEALAREHSEQFLETQRQIEDGIAKYRTLVRAGEEQSFRDFAGELASYMHAITPVLRWTPAERKERSSAFVQTELLPRRMSALSLADRTQKLSEEQLDESSREVNGMLASIRGRLLFLLVLAIALGVALAGVALWRLLRLEAEAQLRFNEIVSTREELKRLSAELVSAQESERRRISRELHDEVGQVLSAIMLGLGNLRSAVKDGNTVEAFRQLRLVEDMTQRNASVVRNISLLLRPAMLDDLGLVPALNWYSREVSRAGTMAVEVEAEAFADDLPEEHRTCVFRIVQEAVRNASRHAGARKVRIQIAEMAGSVVLSVRDDGKGFDPALEAGLGILGMQERVENLAGKLEVKSQPGLGTAVIFTLPLPGGRQTEAPADEFHEMRSSNG